MAESTREPKVQFPLLAVVPATAWGVHQLPDLPPTVSLLVGGTLLWLVCLVVAMACQQSRLASHARCCVIIVLLAVLTSSFVVWKAHAALGERLPSQMEGLDLIAVGKVTGLIRSFGAGVRFDFDLERCSAEVAWCKQAKRIRLSWYGRAVFKASPKAGERWRLTVRLKRPHAPINPGGFDAELRALQNGIAARGYVRAGSKRRPLKEANARLPGDRSSLFDWLDGARAHTAKQMAQALQATSEPVRGTLTALVTGDQSAIPAASWQHYNRTGTSHLMSISGLHVTFFAALTLLLLKRLARLPFVMPASWLIRLPVPAMIAGVAAAAAFAYSLFSGWGIPAQRTSCMLLVAGLALYSGRQRNVAAIMAPAAAAVVILDPWAPLAAGFWLSFVAVGAIVAAAQGVRQRFNGGWLQAARTQWVATIALIPLGATWFGTFSLVSPVANAIAIPLISAVVTPLAILAAALQWLIPTVVPLGSWLLQIIAWPTAWLILLLEWMSAWPHAVHVVGQPPGLLLALSVLGCWVLLTPARPVARWLGALMLLPQLTLPINTLEPGQWRVLGLDVGQGNAVLVQTRHHALLFDTGPSYGEGTGAGDRMVLPALHARQIARLDTLMISHRDSDHVGGAARVLQTFDVDLLSTSMAPGHAVSLQANRYVRCQRGQRWRWDGVTFEVLHPPLQIYTKVKPPKSNAMSCVLRVSGPGGAVLLAGDIGVAQERAILRHYLQDDLKSDVLLGPHHGSNTSSSQAFLKVVEPQWVLFQMGYRNRFRHPAERVTRRYQQLGIKMLRSDQHGAVEWLFSPTNPPQIVSHRLARQRYWRVPVMIEAP
ncbi:MAG: DNA internalization-related competence protein ComEC/Rec2 [Burkholderiaceae bacterium]